MKQSIFEASEALQKWEGMISKKRRSLCWFSRNSEVEATWISLIGWPHKMSTIHELLSKHVFTKNRKTLPIVQPIWMFWWKKTMNGKRNKFVVINETRLKSLSSLIGSAKCDKKYIGFQNVYRKVKFVSYSLWSKHSDWLHNLWRFSIFFVTCLLKRLKKCLMS